MSGEGREETVTADPRIPTAELCVTPRLIERRARESGDDIFAAFASGEANWTYADLAREARETAAALHALGVQPGDRVLCWLPNGPDLLRIWVGANRLGAIFAPLNLAYRGRMLEHAIRVSDASLIVAEAGLAERLAEIDAPSLRTAAILGGPAPTLGSLKVVDEGAFRASATGDALPTSRPVEPWDIQAIIYTSGTTGPSKAVLAPYLQLFLTGTVSVRPFTRNDRSLVHSPLFHVTGMSAVIRAIATGGSIAVLERFSTTNFWGDVRRLGATYAVVMGSIATFLLKQPKTEDERETPLKTLLLAPLTADGRRLAERIGANYLTVFNMSETSRPLMTGLNPGKDGACGRPRPGIEARIVDENDCELAEGQTGELILRADAPWAMTPGYFGDAEATARAWRNGWFHTGDAFYIDADGDFRFVDRIKDAIRRRGENISSFEVEIEVAAHPAVKDCAAVAVRAEGAEDEVLVVIEPVDGERLDPLALLTFLAPRMPHYMVPRYVRQVPALPRTPTLRVQKHLLRAEGVTADTWDREAAGVRIGRDGFSAPPHSSEAIHQ